MIIMLYYRHLLTRIIKIYSRKRLIMCYSASHDLFSNCNVSVRVKDYPHPGDTAHSPLQRLGSGQQ